MIRSETVDAAGVSLHTLVAGQPDAPLLLFLHGFPEYSGAWEDMLARLSDSFLCVAPDQRGYGRSDKPEAVSDYRTGKLVQDAAAVLTHFAPKARAVIGHDWGASVAYALSFSAPQLMGRLVILNGVHPVPFQRSLAAGGAQSAASQYIHYLRDDRAEARLSANGFAKMEALFAEGMDTSWLAGARRDAYLEAWGRPGAVRGMVNWYRASPLKIADPGAPLSAEETPALNPARMRVTMPHLLIWGEEDKALLPEATEGLEALCDNLRRVELPDADHWIVHQKPEAVSALIRDFCS